MATLQELLGNDFKDGMNFDEINTALATKNIADLSSGNYVSKGKFDAELIKAKKIEEDFNAFKTTNMTEEQKRAEQAKMEAEQRELLAKQLETYQLKDKLLDKGFSKDEVNKIIDGNQSPDVYAEIMQVRIDLAKKQAQGQFVKDNTNMPNGATQTNTLSTIDAYKVKLEEATTNHNMAEVAKYTRLIAEENAKIKQ